MKRFLSVCIATAITLLASSALAFNVENVFNVKSPNANCPASSDDVGRYPGDSPSTWCSRYLNDAVLECNARCVVQFPPSCAGTVLGPLIKLNVGSKNTVCLKECQLGYLPQCKDHPENCGSQCSTSSDLVVSCEQEWQDFHDHC